MSRSNVLKMSARGWWIDMTTVRRLRWAYNLRKRQMDSALKESRPDVGCRPATWHERTYAPGRRQHI